MARGRSPKLSVVSTGKIGKDKIKEKKEFEKKIRAKSDLKPPKWLDKRGKEEFERVVKEVQNTEMNLLDNLDLSVLAIYSQAYSQYIMITEELRDMDIELRPKYYRLQKIQVETIMQCSGKIGLAISDRLRLGPPKGEEKPDNPFLQFL